MVAPGNALKRPDEAKARDSVRKTLEDTAPAGNSAAKFPMEANMGGMNKAAMPVTLAPGSKEQRLADLLEMYKSDQISPAEYHNQRAKIMAEP